MKPPIKNSSIVLLSGGLDSALSLLFALDKTTIKYALTFDYGQRSSQNEINASKLICKHYGITQKIISLPFFGTLKQHPFFNSNLKCPEPKTQNLDNLKITNKTAKTVWVPNRNGIFLNVAAAYAETNNVKNLYAGFNAEEAKTFPDNSEDFTKAVNQCFKFSTLNQVQIKCPTIKMNKTEIVRLLINKNFPLQYLWSCYNNLNKMCGNCESCKRLKRAFTENKLQTKAYGLFIKP